MSNGYGGSFQAVGSDEDFGLLCLTDGAGFMTPSRLDISQRHLGAPRVQDDKGSVAATLSLVSRSCGVVIHVTPEVSRFQSNFLLKIHSDLQSSLRQSPRSFTSDQQNFVHFK